MIDFATLQGLTIPEGVVTQIADAQGRVIWAAGGGKVILEVEKITSDTYAGETTYTGEQFILLDIYPKTNGTVKVTYGGLTKTITDTSGAENPNAQTVYFGTLYGVSDSVETPTSGTLTIEGQFQAFGCGGYYINSKGVQTTDYCPCITAVSEWGEITFIPAKGFKNCAKLALSSLPNGITSIGAEAFYGCTSITLSGLPNSVTYIGSSAFYNCHSIVSFTVPNGVERIRKDTFRQCNALQTLTLPATLKSIGSGVAHYLPTEGTYHPKKVIVLATTPPIYENDDGSVPSADMALVQSGYGGANGIIIVPKGCGTAYKAANGWSGHTNEIVEAS